MAEVLMFHHAQGLTEGARKFAADLRDAGHTVHTPDLYEGKTFTQLDDGVAHMKSVGFETLIERARKATEGLPEELVYLGMSMGVGPAQMFAQTRPGAKGALFLYGALPASEFGEWQEGVPLEIHAMEDDPWFKDDLEAARDLARLSGGELFLYPGSGHLFAEEGGSDYDEAAATLLKKRMLSFLEKT
jgi:dienelactone hydrolase